MKTVLDNLDATERMRDVTSGELVMVAGHEDHAHTLAGFSQDLLDHIVVRLWPVPIVAQLPPIDDVTDQVQGFTVQSTQEVQQRLGLAPCGTEVNIRNPCGANLDGVRWQLMRIECVHGWPRSSLRHSPGVMRSSPGLPPDSMSPARTRCSPGSPALRRWLDSGCVTHCP